MSPDAGHQGDGRAGLARRELLIRALAWGGAGAIATTPAVAAAAPRGARRRRGRTVVYDVACLGDTLRIIFAPGAPDSGDLRGSTFSVEGILYKAGTIPGSGFDPASVPGVGHWICRGWFVLHPGRPDPHVISSQEYLIGTIRPDELFTRHQLASSGTEGSADEKQTPVRSVIGGTGMFDGARGTVLQRFHGTNTTVLAGIEEPAPNFRFVFSLR